MDTETRRPNAARRAEDASPGRLAKSPERPVAQVTASGSPSPAASSGRASPSTHTPRKSRRSSSMRSESAVGSAANATPIRSRFSNSVATAAGGTVSGIPARAVRKSVTSKPRRASSQAAHRPLRPQPSTATGQCRAGSGRGGPTGRAASAQNRSSAPIAKAPPRSLRRQAVRQGASHSRASRPGRGTVRASRLQALSQCRLARWPQKPRTSRCRGQAAVHWGGASWVQRSSQTASSFAFMPTRAQKPVVDRQSTAWRSTWGLPMASTE